MQPSPRAETSKLLFPSLRFFIGAAYNLVIFRCFFLFFFGSYEILSNVIRHFSCVHKLALLLAVLRPLILFVGNLFQPVGGFAMQLLRDRDVSHPGGCCGAVPVFLSWREPDHISGSDFLDGSAGALSPTATCRHDQDLAKGMGVLGRARSRFKCDADGHDACRFSCFNQGIDPHPAREIIVLPFDRGSGSCSLDLHHASPNMLDHGRSITGSGVTTDLIDNSLIHRYGLARAILFGTFLRNARLKAVIAGKACHLLPATARSMGDNCIDENPIRDVFLSSFTQSRPCAAWQPQASRKFRNA